MQSTLEAYNVETLEQGIGTVVDVLIDESKDAVDELVTLFIEKIENEANLKDGAIARGRNGEWNARTTEIIEAQHTRGRQIIQEIISTTKNFQESFEQKFLEFAAEDENDV